MEKFDRLNDSRFENGAGILNHLKNGAQKPPKFTDRSDLTITNCASTIENVDLVWKKTITIIKGRIPGNTNPIFLFLHEISPLYTRATSLDSFET